MFWKRKPWKYSQKWFQTISDQELRAEREPVRIDALCKGDYLAERLLNKFNNEEICRMNERYEKEHPNAKPRHREHGWYLPSKD